MTCCCISLLLTSASTLAEAQAVSKHHLYNASSHYMPWMRVRKAAAILLNQVLISDRILNLVFLFCVPVALTDILQLFSSVPAGAARKR